MRRKKPEYHTYKVTITYILKATAKGFRRRTRESACYAAAEAANTQLPWYARGDGNNYGATLTIEKQPETWL